MSFKYLTTGKLLPVGPLYQRPEPEEPVGISRQASSGLCITAKGAMVWTVKVYITMGYKEVDR